MSYVGGGAPPRERNAPKVGGRVPRPHLVRRPRCRPTPFIAARGRVAPPRAPPVATTDFKPLSRQKLQAFLQLAQASCEGDFCAAAQKNHMLAGGNELDLHHLREVYHGGTADAEELLFRQLLLQ
jgi:hypothetical protein